MNVYKFIEHQDKDFICEKCVCSIVGQKHSTCNMDISNEAERETDKDCVDDNGYYVKE